MKDEQTVLLTIIVPCYNSQSYINRCLSSLESVNRKDVLILFVNDGSTDKTKDIIERWTLTHENTRLIDKTNGGYSTAINMGLDNCNSSYVMFLGSDDEVDADGINRICLRLKESNPDILAFSTLKYFDDRKTDKNKKEIDPLTIYAHSNVYEMSVSELYREVGKDAWILFTRDTSRCFKRSIIGNLRYYGKSGVAADGCFSSLIACGSHSFSFVNEICYIWHIHGDSVSSRKKTNEKIIEEANVWAMFFRKLQGQSIEIPDPIIDHYFSYKVIIKRLQKQGLTELSKEHEEAAKAFLTWALEFAKISYKSRIKLQLSNLYFVLFVKKHGVRIKT